MIHFKRVGYGCLTDNLRKTAVCAAGPNSTTSRDNRSKANLKIGTSAASGAHFRDSKRRRAENSKRANRAVVASLNSEKIRLRFRIRGDRKRGAGLFAKRSIRGLVGRVLARAFPIRDLNFSSRTASTRATHRRRAGKTGISARNANTLLSRTNRALRAAVSRAPLRTGARANDLKVRATNCRAIVLCRGVGARVCSVRAGREAFKIAAKRAKSLSRVSGAGDF